MSKRCELQKEYYQQYGNYKGNGKYNDQYVSWLEEQILALRIHSVVRGGDKVRESVQRVEEYLEWLKGNDTPNTPTEPLPTEGVAQNVRDGCRHAIRIGNRCRQCGELVPPIR